MNIQQAAAAAGLTPDTLRFYEKKGVLPRPPRQANGYRAYTEEHVATLRLATGLRQLSVPLAEVRPILEVAHTGVCGDIRGQLVETLRTTLSQVDGRIAGLQRTRDQVSLLLDGLNAMRPDESKVPGADACLEERSRCPRRDLRGRPRGFGLLPFLVARPQRSGCGIHGEHRALPSGRRELSRAW